MAIALSIFGLAFAAFCVWIGIRIFNRRERWAKWTAAGVGLVALYPLSFGPVCWISSQMNFESRMLSAFYQPIVWTFSNAEGDPPQIHPVGEMFVMYALVGAANDWQWFSVASVSVNDAGDTILSETVQWCSLKAADNAEAAAFGAAASEDAADAPPSLR